MDEQWLYNIRQHYYAPENFRQRFFKANEKHTPFLNRSVIKGQTIYLEKMNLPASRTSIMF